MTKREMELQPNYRTEVKDTLDKMVLHIPGVKGGKAFGYPAYKINGKVFAFVGGNGISIKLPAERVAALIAENAAMHPFEVTAGVIWREWVSIRHNDAEQYRQNASLLDESIQFVAEKSST